MESNMSKRRWGENREEIEAREREREKERIRQQRITLKENAGNTAILARQRGFFLELLRKEMLTFTNHVIEQAAYVQCDLSLERYVSVTKKLDDAAEAFFGEDYLSVPKGEEEIKYKWAVSMLAKYIFDEVSGNHKYTLKKDSHWKDHLHQRVEWMLSKNLNVYDPEEFTDKCKIYLPKIIGEVVAYHER